MKTIIAATNRPVAATVLETAYRLTVLAYVAKYRLENWRWIVNWHNAIRDSVAEILACVDPLTPVGDTPLIVTAVLEAHRGLRNELSDIARQQGGADEVGLRSGVTAHAVETLWRIGGAVFSPRKMKPSLSPLIDHCFRLGEALALDDLKAVAQYPENARRPWCRCWTTRRILFAIWPCRTKSGRT